MKSANWCAVLFVVPLAAGAQGPTSDSTSDSVQRIAPVTITATRQKETLLIAPLAVTVIGKRELENRRGYSLDEVLHAVPGVFAQSRYGTSDVRLVIRGFRLRELDGQTPFTDFDRLDVRIRPLSLLRGHLWIREVTLQGSTVRIIRFAEGFNISDLIPRSGGTGRTLDVTVDRLVVTKGTVALEDRARGIRRRSRSRPTTSRLAAVTGARWRGR